MEQLTDLQALLIEHEGLCLTAYRDSVLRKTTIGVGRNLDDKGISRDEAIMLLNRDIADAIDAARRLCPTYDALTHARRMVLVSMAFNLGERGLASFRRFLDAVQREAYDEAADEMLDSDWAQQVKGRAVALARMMRYGVAE